MAKSNLLAAVEELERQRNIPRRLLIEAIETAVASAYQREAGKGEFAARLDLSTGKARVVALKKVVPAVADPATEVAGGSKEAQGRGYGETAEIEIAVLSPEKLGRIAAQTAKQVVFQKIREVERGRVYDEFKAKELEVASGKVQRIREGNVFVELGREEAILPRREIPPKEKYKEGDRVKALVASVRLTPRGTQILLSRAHPYLVVRLFEMEVAEVYDGTIELKAVAREAGFRSKVAVVSHDPAVDAVGACVGQRGIRVQTIVRELGGEKIDVVRWDPDPAVFLRQALSPAQVERVELHPADRTARAFVPDDQLSLAIGKEGQNARLAAKLAGWRVEIVARGQTERAAAARLFEETFRGGSAPAIMESSP